MTLFIQSTHAFRAFYLIVFTILILLSLYGFIESLAQRQKLRHMLIYFVLFFTSFYLYEIMNIVAIDGGKGIDSTLIETLFLNISVHDAVLLLVFFCTLIIFSLTRLGKLKQSKITHMSIKKALDHLNTGLCFYRPNGFVLLINYKMSELSFHITGDSLMDANKFWSALLEHRVLEDNAFVEGRKSPVLQLKNGEIWNFERIKIETQKHEFYQIIAVDITEQERLNQQLIEENHKLQKMNVRLKDLKKFVDQVVHMEEVLAARAKIHDDFGKILLATKLFITQENPSVSDENIINMWKKNISLIYEDVFPEETPNPLKPIIDVANFLGVQIKVSGELPQQKHILKLMLMAARECLTNAVHHAFATELHIEIMRDEDMYIIQYTNNGEIPNSPIKEGSGLSSLRNVVENNASRIDISISPKFCLKLMIPLKGRYEYD